MSTISRFVPGLQVNFELVRSRYTAQASAHGVTLSLRSASRPELGCVSMLKKNFGFIKCCERIVDVFFHINALKEDSTPLELNADVRFVPVMDSDTNKVCILPAGVILASFFELPSLLTACAPC